MSDPPAAATGVQLSAGVVSFADGERVASAVRSLLAQRLPPGVRWAEILLVVSPGSDETEATAHALAREDSRVTLVLEGSRRGKSAALEEVFGRASGDYLVLLNGDAVAQEEAVAHLMASAPPGPGAFAVMARPLPAARSDSLLSRALGLLWDLHHQLHVEMLSGRLGAHLSDELMLLPGHDLPPLRPGIVNDGAFIAQWTVASGGTLHYARDAHVLISTPLNWRQHLRQRLRIARGHRQIHELTGAHPATLTALAKSDPRRALRLVLGQVRARRSGWVAFGALMTVEVVVSTVAFVDELVGVRAPTVWNRPRPAPWPRGGVHVSEESTS